MKTAHSLLLFSAIPLLGCPDEETVATAVENAGQQADVDPNNQSWRCTEDCVSLKGTFVYEGELTGRPQLDFTVIESGQPPTRLHSMPLNDAGEWKVDAPRSDIEGIKITVVGFIDVDQDGPSDGDPAGYDQRTITLDEVAEGEPLVFDKFVVKVTDNPEYTSFPGGSFGSVTPDESAGSPAAVAADDSESDEPSTEPTESADKEAVADEADAETAAPETAEIEASGDGPSADIAVPESTEVELSAPAVAAPPDNAEEAPSETVNTTPSTEDAGE